MWWSWQHLQLKELGGLIQSTVVAGEENALFSVDMEFMGRGELHAVVAAKGKDVGKAPSRFHQWLATSTMVKVFQDWIRCCRACSRSSLQTGSSRWRRARAAIISAQLIRQTPMASTVVLICRI